jgi:hypothetical protein
VTGADVLLAAGITAVFITCAWLGIRYIDTHTR